MTVVRAATAWLGAVLALAACGGDGPTASPATEETGYPLVIPAGFSPLPVPADNPLTVAGVGLGRRLFFDPILSVDSTVACASCHDPALAFSDAERFSRGVAGRTRRQSMSLANVGWAPSLFWDGRAPSLEAQVLEPVVDPVEMGETWQNVEAKLRRHPDYPALFAAAFPGERITRHHVARAVAQYERTLISAGSRYDRFERGEATFDVDQALGLALYFGERGDCHHCHGTSLLTDNRFHNNGLDAEAAALGRAEVTGSDADVGRFRSPSLRNVALTAPYMHDGRFATLEEVLDHYDGGMHRDARLDPLLLGQPDPRGFSDLERDALIAFLHTLTDTAFIEAHRRDAQPASP